jgi:hypothetical protein
MVLAQRDKERGVVTLAEEYLRRLRVGDFDYIWDEMFSYSAKRLLSHSAFQVHFRNLDQLDDILSFDQLNALALGFEMDYGQQRTGFFQGWAETHKQESWFALDPSDWMVFATDDAAIALNGSQDKTFLMLFVRRPGGGYAIDLEALLLFSEWISVRRFSEIATRASVYQHSDTARTFTEFAQRLNEPFQRIKDLVLDQSLVRSRITEERIEWLRSEGLLIKRAQQEAFSEPAASTIDVSEFLRQHLKDYTESFEAEVSKNDVQKLEFMGDAELRKAMAEILRGVNKHDARREARKPHGPAEIADIVLEVQFDGRSYTLCMPFKSGQEMRRKPTVPVDVVYQIWRPHMLLDDAIVVFVTAKPCSQYLRHDINLSKSRMKWPIAVIEGEDLARLLKQNGKLK